jgi:protein-tyrosine phosphatase
MIWPFKRESHDIGATPTLELHDLHSHVLPGLDDGASDTAESLAMLDGLAALGYTRVAVTPHYHHGLFETPVRTEVLRRIEALASSRGDRPPALLPGAEIWFDERLLEPDAPDLLPGLGPSRALLVEFGCQPGSPPRGLERLAIDLRQRGAHLIVAHPERYPDIQRDPDRLQPLRQAGALIQVDLLSLVGSYGRGPRTTAWKLLESGAADAVASDLHRAADLPDLARALGELLHFDHAEFARLASQNPAAVLDGRPEAVTRRD